MESCIDSNMGLDISNTSEDILNLFQDNIKTQLNLKYKNFRSNSIVEQGTRDYCEDVVILTQYEDGILQGVFDGHSGVELAQYCADNLVKTLDKFSKIDWKEKFHYALIDLQSQIDNDYKLSKSCAGTTAVIAFINNNYDIYVTCLGDSRAMIVDMKSGEIMKKKDGGLIEIKDMMENEFNKYNIKINNTNNFYITRSHNYNGINNPEYEYYTQVHNIRFKKTGEVYYADFLDISLQPLRGIGDFDAKNFIRKPELYYWKLTPNQVEHASLILISDGFENNDALQPDKLAKFLSNPGKFIRDAILFTDVPLIKEYISDIDTELCTLDIMKHILEKIYTCLDDEHWIDVLKNAFTKFKKAYLLYENSFSKELDQLLQMVVNYAILLGSHDNITIQSTIFSGQLQN